MAIRESIVVLPVNDYFFGGLVIVASYVLVGSMAWSLVVPTVQAAIGILGLVIGAILFALFLSGREHAAEAADGYFDR